MNGLTHAQSQRQSAFQWTSEELIREQDVSIEGTAERLDEDEEVVGPEGRWGGGGEWDEAQGKERGGKEVVDVEVEQGKEETR